MLTETVLSIILDNISSAVGDEVHFLSSSPVSGGNINQCHALDTSAGKFFVKLNDKDRFPGMFESEARGLRLLSQPGVIKAPEPLAVGTSDDSAFLVLHFLPSGNANEEAWWTFGSELAMLHEQTNSEFGLDHDNFIGSLPQVNTPGASWAAFFTDCRLVPQCRTARDSGLMSSSDSRQFDRLFSALDNLFPEEPPALLHGDLWSGNFLIDQANHAHLIDPAVYYGHREMDLAMTRLFGGFAPDFYQGYVAQSPLEPGWEERTDLANLYPIMVHANLFGAGYLQQAKGILRRFV